MWGSHFLKTKNNKIIHIEDEAKNKIIIIIRILLKLRHSVHLLIFPYIYVPRPQQSQSRLYSH
jgi:hypothetical protein